jgi:hypothetical protein
MARFSFSPIWGTHCSLICAYREENGKESSIIFRRVDECDGNLEDFIEERPKVARLGFDCVQAVNAIITLSLIPS